MPLHLRLRLGTSCLAWLLAAHALWLLSGSGVSRASERPNFILAMGDDHGWDETGYNGHPHLQTPVLDEMAAQGLRLDRFYAAHPSCSPTRGSIITGRHPNRYGTFAPNWSLRPQEISLAQLLAQAGYACGHFGKWHLGPVKKESPTSPGAMGFQHWLSHDNFFELNPTLSRDGGPPQTLPGESSEILVQEASRFIARAVERKQPFFVVIWFGSPHEPYSGLDRDLALYDRLPASYKQKRFRLTSNETGRSVQRPLDEVLRERYAEITAMDRALGSLRQQLQQQGVRRDTLLWYCGDNGTPGDGIVTSPFRGHKGQMYEGGLRVPGIIEWPQRITAGQVSDFNSVTTDILPTLCDLLGLPLPARPLDGTSLKPLLAGQTPERTQPLCFWSYNTGPLMQRKPRPYIDPHLQQGTTPLVKMMGDRHTRNFQNVHHPADIPEELDHSGPRAIIEGRYKLVLEASGKQSRELFNLHDDPAEAHNLVDSHEQLARQLGQRLQQWQDSVLNSLRGGDY